MKKIISAVLCAAALMTANASFAAEPIMSGWAVSEVTEAVRLGIADATLPNDYTGAVNRWNFCVMAYNTVKAYLYDAESETPFSDTDDSRITALYDAGIVTGKTDTEFKPFDKLTREEAAAIMTRLVNYLKIPVNEIAFVYDDDNEVSPWARPYIDTVSALGLMSGYENRFMPQNQYTIEQGIATMLRLHRILPE